MSELGYEPEQPAAEEPPGVDAPAGPVSSLTEPAPLATDSLSVAAEPIPFAGELTPAPMEPGSQEDLGEPLGEEETAGLLGAAMWP